MRSTYFEDNKFFFVRGKSGSGKTIIKKSIYSSARVCEGVGGGGYTPTHTPDIKPRITLHPPPGPENRQNTPLTGVGLIWIMSHIPRCFGFCRWSFSLAYSPQFPRLGKAICLIENRFGKCSIEPSDGTRDETRFS